MQHPLCDETATAGTTFPRLPEWRPDAAPRRELGAVPPRRSAAGPRGEVPGGAFEALQVRMSSNSIRWLIRPCILNVRLSWDGWIKYHLNDPYSSAETALLLHPELPHQH
jgi:hypothetical protein